MYPNMDGLVNKKDELLSTIGEKKKLNTLSEIKAKRQDDVDITEYNIPGYTIFFSHKIKREVAIYFHAMLNA